MSNEITSTEIIDQELGQIDQHIEAEIIAAQGNPVVLPEQCAKELRSALDEVVALQYDVAAREQAISEKAETIKYQFEKIKDIPHLIIKADLGAMFERTANDYKQLIAHVLGETKFYLEFYQEYLDGTATIVRHIKAIDPENLEFHVTVQVKFIRRLVKDHKKNLAVIFSRYDHGFTRHMQNLHMLELSRGV